MMRPFRCITSDTLAIASVVTCAVTGSLVQLGTDCGPTPEHAPANASPETVTVPTGVPVMVTTELEPAATSNACDTVRAPAAVMLRHPTSAGTSVIATVTAPTASGPGGAQPVCGVTASKAIVDASHTSVERSRCFISPLLSIETFPSDRSPAATMVSRSPRTQRSPIRRTPCGRDHLTAGNYRRGRPWQTNVALRSHHAFVVKTQQERYASRCRPPTTTPARCSYRSGQTQREGRGGGIMTFKRSALPLLGLTIIAGLTMIGGERSAHAQCGATTFMNVGGTSMRPVNATDAS